MYEGQTEMYGDGKCGSENGKDVSGADKLKNGVNGETVGNAENAENTENTENAGPIGYSIEELVELVAELAGKHTGGDSSSITYEKAQQFMGAVQYCINECNESVMCTGEAEGPAGVLMRIPEKPASAREAYEQGYQIILKKTACLRDLYHDMIQDFDSYGNCCLEETVMSGLPRFLQWYDVRFHPQDTLLTLDYPILKDLSGMTGIDAVLQYTRCIAFEQAFLKGFDRKWVCRSLEAYTGDPAGMIENLCSILLPDLIGHMILKKPLREIGYSQEEYRILADGFAKVMKEGQRSGAEYEVFGADETGAERKTLGTDAAREEDSREKYSQTDGSMAEESKLELYLKHILCGLINSVFSSSISGTSEARAAEQYICGAIPDIAARIRHGIAFGCLDQVFRV